MADPTTTQGPKADVLLKNGLIVDGTGEKGD